MVELLDWIMDNFTLFIIFLVSILFFLGALSYLITNTKANSEIKRKTAELEREYAAKREQLYQQNANMLQSQQAENERRLAEKRTQMEQEASHLYQTSLLMKRLHLICTKSAFLFEKTAIDDTLIDKKRYNRSIKEPICLVSPVEISASVCGTTGNIYHTTLHSCTCTDFQTHKTPCKHMYKLAEELGLLTPLPYNPRDALLETEKELNEHYVTQYEALYHKCQSKYREMENIRKSDTAKYPWLAKLYADYDAIKDKQCEENLRTKYHPAVKAADAVKEIRQEKYEWERKAKMLEYQLNCYQTLFPWLEEYEEASPTETYDYLQAHSEPDTSEYNAVMRIWLTREEYDTLSNTEKYQRALDRYRKRQKSLWQVGIDYERYIGYLYEQKGYIVKYNGALMGVEDMGRDLIADNGGELLIIQCKRWAKDRQIHENHIFQLYGTMTLSKLQNPRVSVSGVFVTTTTLTETAKRCADFLHIKVIENKPYEDYPMIKCNVSKTGEKIYHLPMDQYYDRAIITPRKGDCYVSTVQEAENLGFRRSYRWSGSQVNN